MKKTLYILLSVCLLSGLTHCSSDDNTDPEREKKESQLKTYKLALKEEEDKKIEMTKYCQDNASKEGGYNKCYEGFIAPIDKSIEFYNEKITELEKELGIK